jgi:ion channel-forming bestrophin family protein
VVAYAHLEWRWAGLPWVPVALVGTAVSFLVGFKNNATYDRAWEARTIWGAIVNGSRSWALMVRDLPAPSAAVNDASVRDATHALIYRHLAWITALRWQLRAPRVWENHHDAASVSFRAGRFTVDEHARPLSEALAELLPADEVHEATTAANAATMILSRQSAQIRALRDAGVIGDYACVALMQRITDSVDQQGRCERIKNFPYPRQFATANIMFVRLFVVLVPFGLVREFDALGPSRVWMTVPISVLVSWVFLTMERVGESTANPFQGDANDVPITALSRTIEIDLRAMLGESPLPPPLTPVNGILM